jgi:hypothetical protein
MEKTSGHKMARETLPLWHFMRPLLLLTAKSANSAEKPPFSLLSTGRLWDIMLD